MTQANSDNLPPLDDLQAFIGVLVPEDLLSLALTHPSAVGEGLERTLCSNQRLEFLGDTVVGAIVAEHLYRNEPLLPEGDLTQRKAAAVQKTSLSSAAARLDLGKYLRLGRGEATSGGRRRDSVLADALEAVIGAVYLSHGLDAARDFALRALTEELESVERRAGNVKNDLQEYTQSVGLGTPVYRTVASEGPAHERRFAAEVLLMDESHGRGEGKSKKEAECNAATVALQALMLQGDVSEDVEAG